MESVRNYPICFVLIRKCCPIFKLDGVNENILTHRSVGSFLARMFPRPAFQLNVYRINDIEEIFYYCNFSINGFLTWSILKQIKILC